jgi:hypothetical protein
MVKRAISFYVFIIMAVIAIGFGIALIFLNQDELPIPMMTGFKTYENKVFGFSFSYPESGKIIVDSGFPLSIGVPIIRTDLPQAIFSGTNLIEAAFMVGASSSPASVDACLIQQDNEKIEDQPVKISGTEFKIFSSNGAAAGNLYETTSYRAVKNRICYESLLLLHSANIQNYPEGSVKQFDKAAAIRTLKNILGTLKFYP